jgi:integrase
MAYRAQGFRLRRHERTGLYFVRFRHAGRRYEKSTGARDSKDASIEAARIYADIVSGRKVARPVSAALDEAVASYLADFELANSASWAKIVTIYFRAHILPFFGSFDAFTLASYGDYIRERIQHVTRVTVRKEISALRQFRAWCVEHDLSLPEVPSVPKHGRVGRRHKHARKRKATIITPDEAARIIAAMPERGPRAPRHRVRDVFTVLWETGLRPVTVLALETPLHFRKGQDHLFISREVDKEGFERKAHLSDPARAALDRAVADCPPKIGGRIFTVAKASLRHYLAAAVAEAGLTDRNISVYDFKHSRISLGANTLGVPLAGIAHMVGHKHISTTALYVQTGEAAAKQALAVMGRLGRSNGGTIGGTNRSKRSARSRARDVKSRNYESAKAGT